MALLKKKKKEQEVKPEEKKQEKPKAQKKAPKKAAAAKKTPAKKEKRGISKKALTVLVRPLVTEKTAQLSENNVMVFEVSRDANRVEIKNAFNELYGVVPVRVNVMNMRGKRVAFGRKLGKRKDWKKAFITLPEGKRIDIFEGI